MANIPQPQPPMYFGAATSVKSVVDIIFDLMYIRK
jgi:hypothetical protein